VRARRALIVAVAGLALLVASAAGAGTTTHLSLGGFGQVKLGMKRQAAVSTGWLAHRGTGCQLGGKPFPITYTFTGRNAPHGIKGTAQFDHGKLDVMSFTAGVSTSTGVTVGKTTATQMVTAYRTAGYTVRSRFDSVFAGTFVTVTKKGKAVIQGFAPHAKLTTLGLPFVPVCD
jgi:hypothetical protein